MREAGRRGQKKTMRTACLCQVLGITVYSDCLVFHWTLHPAERRPMGNNYLIITIITMIIIIMITIIIIIIIITITMIITVVLMLILMLLLILVLMIIIMLIITRFQSETRCAWGIAT